MPQPFKALFLHDGRRRKNKDDPKCNEYMASEEWTAEGTIGMIMSKLIAWKGGEYSGTWENIAGDMEYFEYVENKGASATGTDSAARRYDTDL